MLLPILPWLLLLLLLLLLRWYFKLEEVKRVLLQRAHVVNFQETYDDYPERLVLDAEDFLNLAIYVNSLQTLSDASTLFEGESYPTATSVIPFLDQVPVNHVRSSIFGVDRSTSTRSVRARK